MPGRDDAAAAPAARPLGAGALAGAAACVAEALERFEAEFRFALRAPDGPVPAPLAAAVNRGGKRLRPALYLLSQGAADPARAPEPGAAVWIELLHAASLLHDDVVDGTDRRRGSASLNAAEGNRFSVLSGDYLMAKTLSLAVAGSDPFALPILSAALLGMTRAELAQAAMDASAGTEAAAIEIATGKTARLMEAACELGGRRAGAPEARIAALRRFGLHFGLAFQLRDDILDITGDEAVLGKPVGQDAVNGRWTLPLVLALDAADAEERESCLRRLDRRSAEDREWIHGFIVRRGGTEGAERTVRTALAEARRALAALPPSVYRDGLAALCGADADAEAGGTAPEADFAASVIRRGDAGGAP
jgi:octaprenyl-diphosphate synthase